MTHPTSGTINKGMGLLFALQPFEPKSTSKVMHLRSHFRKFAMGASFLFAGLFIGVMILAAYPVFKLMRTEGGWFDQIIVAFFALVIILYPLLGAACFLFEEHVILEKRPDSLFNFKSYNEIFFIKWNKRFFDGFRLEDLQEENWVGLINAAAIKAKKKNKSDRYATKGHWLLTLKKNGSESFVIERRAKKEEIEWLKFLIEKHFAST